MVVDLSNYEVFTLRDVQDTEMIYNIILLNKKHSAQEFQKAINNGKEKHAEEIGLWGCDWEYIKEELGDFDFIELSYDDSYWLEY